MTTKNAESTEKAATYCIEYAGNRPDIRGRTYQEASSETEVRDDWMPGEHGLRIVRITKLPNSVIQPNRAKD